MVRKHEKIELPKLNKVSAFFSTPLALGENSVIHYPINQLLPNNLQPRRYFDEVELKQLADSIKHCGVLEPLLVTKEIDGKRTILAGERRWRAAAMAEQTSVPIYELELPPEIAAQVPLIENLLRRDLNPFEELEGYLLLLQQNLLPLPEFTSYYQPHESPLEGVVRLLFAMRNAQSQRGPVVDSKLTTCITEVFSGIGTSSWSSFVTHRLPLRKLSTELQDALREGWLDYTKALEVRRLSAERLGNEELARQARTKLLNTIRKEKLPFREVKARVSALLNSVTSLPSERESNIKTRLQRILNNFTKQSVTLPKSKEEKLQILLTQLEKLLEE
jgi:ParB family chromosome partitioning protein